MSAGNPDWLRGHTDAELLAIADDLASRAEQFDTATRQLINDELRRRKLPIIEIGRSRH